MDCRELSSHLSDLSGLPADQRCAWERHAQDCATCGPPWRKAVALDHLLSRWEAPAPPQDLSRRVLEELAREPEVDCDRVAAQVHSYVADELSPPETAGIEAHLSRCEPCSRSVQECLRLAQVLRSWDAPRPAPDLVARVSASLAPRVRRTVPGGTIQMPRLLAALLVVAAALGVANLLRTTGGGGAPPHQPLTAEAPAPRAVAEPSLRTVNLLHREPGGFDVAVSFSDQFQPARGRLLRDARRGLR